VCGARLVVLHVVLNPTPIHPVFPQLSQRDVNEEIRVGRIIAEQLSQQVLQLSGPDLETDVEVDFGVPDTVIVRKAEELQAQLLVVASRGTTGLARLLLGSVAERVVRHAHCPVLVARPATGSGRILAATDLSDPSLPAVKQAAAEARAHQLRLSLLHVIALPWQMLSGLSPLGPVPAVPDDETLEGVRVAALSTLRELLVRFEVEGEVKAVVGHQAAAAILTEAEALNAELIVVGTRGQTALSRMTLGSVAERVVSHAHCSVLVVRLGA
jgi:nucleotide-binding universal stress UspA family protein